jgi:hypothetical protein
MLALGAGESVTLDTCSGFTAFTATLRLTTNPHNTSVLSASAALGSACVFPGAVSLQFNNTGAARTLFALVGGTA